MKNHNVTQEKRNMKKNGMLLVVFFICLGMFLIGDAWATDFDIVHNVKITAITAWPEKNANVYGIRVYASQYPSGCNYFYIDVDGPNKAQQHSMATAALLADRSVDLQKGRDDQDTTQDMRGCRLNAIILR